MEGLRVEIAEETFGAITKHVAIQEGRNGWHSYRTVFARSFDCQSVECFRPWKTILARVAFVYKEDIWTGRN